MVMDRTFRQLGENGQVELEKTIAKALEKAPKLKEDGVVNKVEDFIADIRVDADTSVPVTPTDAQEIIDHANENKKNLDSIKEDLAEAKKSGNEGDIKDLEKKLKNAESEALTKGNALHRKNTAIVSDLLHQQNELTDYFDKEIKELKKRPQVFEKHLITHIPNFPENITIKVPTGGIGPVNSVEFKNVQEQMLAALDKIKVPLNNRHGDPVANSSLTEAITKLEGEIKEISVAGVDAKQVQEEANKLTKIGNNLKRTLKTAYGVDCNAAVEMTQAAKNRVLKLSSAKIAHYTKVNEEITTHTGAKGKLPEGAKSAGSSAASNTAWDALKESEEITGVAAKEKIGSEVVDAMKKGASEAEKIAAGEKKLGFFGKVSTNIGTTIQEGKLVKAGGFGKFARGTAGVVAAGATAHGARENGTKSCGNRSRRCRHVGGTGHGPERKSRKTAGNCCETPLVFLSPRTRCGV
jgi:hypothetical protein